MPNVRLAGTLAFFHVYVLLCRSLVELIESGGSDMNAALIRQAIDTLAEHDAASRRGFDERTTVRAWSRTESRRRYHFDADMAVLLALLVEGT